MNKLLVHLVLVVSSVILISGCTSGGSEIAEEEVDAFFGPLPSGLPVFVDIVEPYLGTSSSNQDEIALFSYAPQETAAGLATETEVFSTDSNIAVSLNTQADSAGQSEFTLLVKNDSIYVVNHSSNEIRLLNHFTTQVCEILPIEKVTESIVGEEPNKERHLTTLHDEKVYIVTADDGGTVGACDVDSKKRYYELPLDHQLEASVADGGVSNIINLVSEALARSKIIFGWIPDPDNSGKDIIEYAYLGYDSESKSLSLFDKDQTLIWKQERVLQEFDRVDLGQGKISSKYVFDIRQLDIKNLFYLIQLGLDVFVVDSGLDLLSKQQSEVGNILADKVVSLVAGRSSELDYAVPAFSLVDDDDLIIVDNNKIYNVPFQANAVVRDPTITTKVFYQNPISIDNKLHLKTPPFSQFDLKICDDDDIACEEAHDVEAQTWQFFTPCEEQYGCSIVNEVNDFCETEEEWLQTQSNRTRCTPSDYRHIAELNKVENDASLLSYMQYAEKYIRQKNFILNKDQLFVTARMNQKDIILAYNFKRDFSQPKLLREHVYLGGRASLFGMEPWILNNNLYLTALQESAIKFNECYKNGQQVSCQLDDLGKGSSTVCTGKDLAEGLCVNKFTEYESKAFFCSEAQLNDFSCSDDNLNQLDDLAIETDEEDAKWLALYDYPKASYEMYLLAGQHQLAVDNNQLDEGRLFSPSLYSIDQATGQKETPETPVTSLEGLVERVVGGWISKEPESGVSEVYGHIDVVSEEIKQTGGTKVNESSLVTYLLEQTFEDSSSSEPNFIKAPKVAERSF